MGVMYPRPKPTIAHIPSCRDRCGEDVWATSCALCDTVLTLQATGTVSARPPALRRTSAKFARRRVPPRNRAGWTDYYTSLHAVRPILTRLTPSTSVPPLGDLAHRVECVVRCAAGRRAPSGNRDDAPQDMLMRKVFGRVPVVAEAVHQ